MIKVLDSFIADKIAAGEVIERPVSIVKELVENSIDAGSKSIIVEIKNGGKSYIRVTDDGCGIAADEIQTAFLRHATSKISSINDLDNINSLGFRGEALASIAAVSRVTIVSRPESSASGTRLIMHGGKEVSSDTVGANIGTTLVVEDVFYNTPARRKFMGSDAREASVIIELIEHYAIYYANIRFMLVNNGVTIFTTSGNASHEAAIQAVYPSREYSKLIHIESEHVNGYISDPGTTKNNRRGQLFFVNGRLIDSAVIEKGIEKGYGNRIFSGYPIAILFINVEPKTIDVNIHPGKKEINFLNKDVIVEEISNAINNVMDLKQSIPEPVKYVSTLKEDSIEYKAVSESKPVEIHEYLNNLDREIKNITENIEPPLISVDFNEEVENIKYLEKSPFRFEDIQYAGYIFNSYIVFQDKDEIYILDQHAAHERVFYEQFMFNYRQTDNSKQPILTPIVLNVSSAIYSLDRMWMRELTKIGYDIEDFGPNTFIIKSIPTFMTLNEAENFARTFIENVNEYTDNITVIDKLIMKSCKSAVKANNSLSKIEIDELIDKLAKCDNPFSCPHGRPTFIKFTKYDIERSFKRK